MSPDVREVGTAGELVGPQVGQQDGVLLHHPVLHILHPGEAGAALQEQGPPHLCHNLVLPTE